MIEIKWAETMICPLQRDKCADEDCMAWRWFDPPEPEPRIVEHSDPLAEVEPTDRPADVPKSYGFWPCDPKEGTDACWIEPENEAVKRRRGYCGAFGKPEFAE